MRLVSSLIRIALRKQLEAVDTLVARGFPAWSGVREMVRTHAAPRNPVIRLQPRRVTQISPCRRWFVIIPLASPAGKTFRAWRGAGMGSLDIKRSFY